MKKCYTKTWFPLIDCWALSPERGGGESWEQTSVALFSFSGAAVSCAVDIRTWSPPGHCSTFHCSTAGLLQTPRSKTHNTLQAVTRSGDKIHTDHPAGGFVHLVIEYLVWTGRFQVQITVYLEKMNHNFNNCLLLSAGACAQRGRFKI